MHDGVKTLRAKRLPDTLKLWVLEGTELVLVTEAGKPSIVTLANSVQIEVELDDLAPIEE